MKRRKISAILMAVVMTISMCACGGGEQAPTAVPTDAPMVTEAPTEAPTVEPTKEPQNPLLAQPADIDFSAINSQMPGRVTVEGTEFVVDGERLYINGVNTPWDNWNDFGGTFSKSFWQEHFATLRENGINAVRVWISCDGTTGLSISKDGYINGATTKHWEHLDKLFTYAQENGIYIMATLMSFDHFKNSNANHEAWRNLVQDDAKMDSYIKNYLIPFCERYDDFDSLWSIDLCNEPDWIHENAECGKLAWDNICEFFAKEAAAIPENSDILVTVGFGIIKYNSEDYSGNMGADAYLQSLYANENAYLDFYSTHYYEWEAQFYGFPFDKSPEAFKLDGTKPSVLGECPAVGTLGTTKFAPAMSGDEMYINTYNNGWDGIMGWSSNGVDDCGSLEDFKAGAMEVYQKINE